MATDLPHMERLHSLIKGKKSINIATAIVFSTSLGVRNYLRRKVSDCGFQAVCFENEAICFDNIMPIQPGVVIAETDDTEIVWRFVLALHSTEVKAPLLIVSNRLDADRILPRELLQVPVDTISMNFQQHLLLTKLDDFFKIDVTRGKISNGFRSPLLVGQTEPIKQIQSILPSIAGTRDSVLIAGEQGTGKELLARLIVSLSEKEECFIKIDCAKLDDDMLVNGWLKKSLCSKKNAEFVTIFMDHLDQLPMASQAKMLLVMDKIQQIWMAEGTTGNGVIRFIASSEQQVEGLVQKRRFRKDLLYRLNVIPIAIPALRERKDDISLLMDHFIIEACVKNRKCVMVPSQQAREMCYMHDWPRNVAELRQQMYRVVEEGSEKCLYANKGMPKIKESKQRQILNFSGKADLPKPHEIKGSLSNLQNISLKDICNEFVSRTERRLMKKALESTNWNRKKAAEILRISYKSMLNKMKAYDI